MSNRSSRTEEISVRGDQLIALVKELIRQGNLRRLAIKSKEGNTLIEVPLTVGVVGTLLLPTLAALGAVAALVTECTVVIERVDA